MNRIDATKVALLAGILFTQVVTLVIQVDESPSEASPVAQIPNPLPVCIRNVGAPSAACSNVVAVEFVKPVDTILPVCLARDVGLYPGWMCADANLP